MTRMRRGRRLRGLSLFEIMFVLAILGILMAIGTGSYRRMQLNNQFTTDVSRFAGELRGLGTRARAVGVMQTNPVVNPANNTALTGFTAPAGTQGWRWRTIERTSENGPIKVTQEGRLGERQTVRVRWATAYNYRGNLTHGVWLELGPPTGNPVMQVIFEPDGTPLDPGTIELTNGNLTYSLEIQRLGGIKGP